MTKLEEDSYIFTIPAKFPEAYYRTIEELKRRKVYNLAISKICSLMHRATKAERKGRDAFNGKFGDYLPVSIQADLSINPIDILYCQQEALVIQDYQLIENIDIPERKIAEKLEEILQKIFKDITFNLRDLFSNLGNQNNENTNNELNSLKA